MSPIKEYLDDGLKHPFLVPSSGYKWTTSRMTYPFSGIASTSCAMLNALQLFLRYLKAYLMLALALFKCAR